MDRYISADSIYRHTDLNRISTLWGLDREPTQSTNHIVDFVHTRLKSLRHTLNPDNTILFNNESREVEELSRLHFNKPSILYCNSYAQTKMHYV